MADLVRRTAGADAAGVRPEVVFGKPAEEIVRFAAAHRADLIVLASHRIDVPGGEPDLGTVSYKVSFLAPCPIEGKSPVYLAVTQDGKSEWESISEFQIIDTNALPVTTEALRHLSLTS